MWHEPEVIRSGKIYSNNVNIFLITSQCNPLEYLSSDRYGLGLLHVPSNTLGWVFGASLESDTYVSLWYFPAKGVILYLKARVKQRFV